MVVEYASGSFETHFTNANKRTETPHNGKVLPKRTELRSEITPRATHGHFFGDSLSDRLYFAVQVKIILKVRLTNSRSPLQSPENHISDDDKYGKKSIPRYKLRYSTEIPIED